jgi:nicotinic acid mononucleotide adenylyltransferase
VAAGVYPGSFNPPTVAHLAIAEAARQQCSLDRVDLTLSTVTLGKEADAALAEVGQRLTLLERLTASRPWLGVQVTDAQLLADIAHGYDVVILGADKWQQLLEVGWYGSVEARDAALRRLPRLAVAPRPPHPLDWLDRFDAVVLDIDAAHQAVSATDARNGRAEWVAPEARD